MWGNKKRNTPRAADPEPKKLQMNRSLKPAPAFWERPTKTNKDAIRPTGAIADRATSRPGSTLHVKGEISGNEDLHIDGTVEGLVQLDERQLTVGTAGKATADIIAGEAVVCGKVKGNVRAKGRIEVACSGGAKAARECGFLGIGARASISPSRLT